MSLTSEELRQKYLDFFAKRDHSIIPSASLLPDNDPSTLFTGSGMQPMIPYLLGEKHALGKRLTDSQKCFRAQDIEDVGDNNHTTFFEMLGNWSLGDYFKKEQITWVFEFLTKDLGLDPNRLYVTAFKGNKNLGISKDTEVAALWQELFIGAGTEAKMIDNPDERGLQGGRIFFYDENHNWWSRSGPPSKMPVGEPGGPDSEIFWDFGAEHDFHNKSKFKHKPCHVNCDCGRFFEIGNNVFMEYRKTESGFEPLPQKNVDFGGGLERIAAAVNNEPDVLKIDLFNGARRKLEQISGKKYGHNNDETYAFRVILDHLRAATFLTGDGAYPSNKDQGYFTRRLIRRSVRFANQLGVDKNFCGDLTKEVIKQYGNHYTNLTKDQEKIIEAINKEETKFRNTLAQGLKMFSKLIGNLNSGDSIATNDAFDLYQSYGFPFELIVELAAEKGLAVSKKDFDKKRAEHQGLSRAGAEQKFAGGLADHSEISTKYHTATHLLHAALLKILGPLAVQKGSNITQDRMRFDFAHPEKLTPAQKQAAEDLVNAAIQKDYKVSFQEMSYNDAKQMGAIGLFADKYADKIKVYTVGDPKEKASADPASPTFSREVCGGPHVEHTGLIGKFKIKKEESIGAGLRRIKATIE